MRMSLRACVCLLFCLSLLTTVIVSPALASSGAHLKRDPHRVIRKHHRKRARHRAAAARISTSRRRPNVTTAAATAITATGATMNGSVNPNGYVTKYYFQYGTSTSYGSRTPAVSVGSGTAAIAVTAPVSRLTSSTTYHFRLVAKNSNGTTTGSDVAFVTPSGVTSPGAPSVTTAAATSITTTTATLNGSVNPNGAAADYYYQYGSTSSYGLTTATQSAGSSTSIVSGPITLSGLSASTAYHFRIVASSSGGVSYGADQAFTTQAASGSSYDQVVLADHPVAFYDMSGTAREGDLTGNAHTGTYNGGTPGAATLPDGERAADFNAGSSHSGQYMTIPSSAVFSIPTTKQFTWEAWIRPDVLQFANPASSDEYVDWMGKCQDYSPSCEWEARMYSAQTPEGRPDRLSAYVFNPSAGLGSGADWQPASGVISAGEWLHVIGEYQTLTTPSPCSSAYPGTINIWVDGIEQNFADHAPTGCMSQYSVVPRAGSSPVNIATMGLDSWFQGAVGKVAIYDSLLSQAQINSHFTTMTGTAPSGSCANTCTVP